MRYKVVDYLNSFRKEGKTYELKEKLIITYSSTRAKKDREDRERLLEKAQLLLQNQSKITANCQGSLKLTHFGRFKIDPPLSFNLMN